jgi:hypothetical protein
MTADGHGPDALTPDNGVFDGQQVDRPEKSEAEQRAFFDKTLACALHAEARAGAIVHVVAIAGVRIRLQFAGPGLEREFMPALAHLLVEPESDCDAVFHIWDSESTGVEMVPPPCDHTAFSERGDLWGFSSRRIRSAFHWSEYSVCLLDLDAGVGTYWVQTTANLPYWSKSSPLRTLFHWLLERWGLQLIHGAAIGTEHGGVLITGKGGVGKSTSSLACLAAGMTFLGDDYLIVGLDPEPTAYTLYSTAKLVPAQLAQLPELAPLVRCEAGADEKAVIYLYPDHRQRLANSLPLRWLLTPRFGEGEETGFEPVAATELHRAAAFTTMSQLPHAGLRTHRFIGRLVEQVSRARLVLGRDIRSVPKALAELIESDVEISPPERLSALPMVSVIIPVFNGARFLRDAIDAVLVQDYPALEVIIVDDGSTDDIEQAVAALPIDVRFFRQKNAGPSAARNRGLRDANGELIAFLDVDDLWPENNLVSLAETLLGDPTADVVIGCAQLARIDREVEGGMEFVGNPDESFPHYIGSALYRRAVFQRIGDFDEDMWFGEDTDWFTRAKEQALNVKRLDQISLIVRRHEANMTRGKTMLELNLLRTFKKALDRTRDAIERTRGIRI